MLKQNQNSSGIICKRSFFVLFVLSWIVGLLFGFALSRGFAKEFASLMRAASVDRVSIVGLFVVVLLPFLLSALSVYFSAPVLILPIIFIKAVSFGCCCMGIVFSFGTASWLVRIMLMFSDLVGIAVLLWFLIRCIFGSKSTMIGDIFASFFLLFFIGAVDYFWVSPFLVELMYHS